MYATLLVDVLDRDGCLTGRAVPVSLEYERTIDRSYGADADGRRGIRLVEYEIREVWTDAVLLKEEEEQVLRDARAAFLDSPGRYDVRVNRRLFV